MKLNRAALIKALKSQEEAVGYTLDTSLPDDQLLASIKSIIAEHNIELDGTEGETVETIFARKEAPKPRLKLAVSAESGEIIEVGNKATRVNGAIHNGATKAKIWENLSAKSRYNRRFNLPAHDHRKSVFEDAEIAEAMAAHTRLKSLGSRDYPQRVRDLEIVKTMTIGTDNAGGSTVEQMYAAGLIELFDQYGAARRVAGVTNMPNHSLRMHRLTGDVTSSWGGEAVAITASDAATNNVNLVSEELKSLAKVSLALLSDSALGIADVLARSIARASEGKIDTAYFTGTGISTTGGFKGVIGEMTTAGTNPEDCGGLQLATGDTWAEITAENIQDMMGLQRVLDVPQSQVFVCHSKFYWQQLVKFMDRVVYSTTAAARTGLDVSATPPMQLWGYPVIFSNVMPTASTGTSARDTVPLLFGDFPLGTKLGIVSGGPQIAESDQRYFDEGLWAIRSIQRVAINCHDVGTSSAAGAVVGLIMEDA